MTTQPLSTPTFPPSHTTPRRVLNVLSHTDPRYGGLSAAVPASGENVARRGGFSASLAAFCQPEEHYRPLGYEGERISFWPMDRSRWVFNRALASEFSQLVGQADLLHIHGLWEESTRVAARTAERTHKPYVLSAHGMLEPWALQAGRLKKQLYASLIERHNVAQAACLHALTPAEARQYREFGARGPIAVVPNAVAVPARLDADLFLSAHPALRGQRLVLFMARLHPKKGADLLLEAWAAMGATYPEAHLVLAGPDSEGLAKKLAERARACGLERRVSFPGMLHGEMKWSALAAAECFVLPSHSEGLSVGLLEAMGAGVPVLATHACNMPDITTYNAGWETEPAVSPLAAALADMLGAAPAENAARGARGACLIAERYSPSTVARQMSELYEFACDGTLPRSFELQTGEPR